MLFLLADLVDFRHRGPSVLDLNVDPGQPAQMEKPAITHFNAELCLVCSDRIHHHVSSPEHAAEPFSRSSKVLGFIDFSRHEDGGLQAESGSCLCRHGGCNVLARVSKCRVQYRSGMQVPDLTAAMNELRLSDLSRDIRSSYTAKSWGLSPDVTVGGVAPGCSPMFAFVYAKTRLVESPRILGGMGKGGAKSCPGNSQGLALGDH